MTAVLDRVPLGTQAAILEAVLAEQYPKLALPTIAHRYKLTLVELQAITNRHGYPDTDQMATSVRRLRAKAEAAANDQTLAAVDPDDGEEEPYTETLQTVKVKDLHPDPSNPREQLTGIDELAESIAAAGLLQPIVARRDQGRLYVVMGHRRLAAVQLLCWDEVKVIVRSRMLSDEVLAAMLIENGQRAGLDPIEEARALRRLKAQLDCNDTELGHRIGRSMEYVNGRLLLLELSIEDQDAVRAGRLGITAAKTRARFDSGRVRPGAHGRPAAGHLSSTHELADAVQARCTKAGHKAGKGKGVGGVGCGICWEAVIRQDERRHISTLSTQRGECVSCGHQLDQPPVAP